jgi:hypothetical protein
MGILIFDQQGRIAYLNRWVQQQAQANDPIWVGQTLAQAFPCMAGSYFEKVLARATDTGFAAFLSNSLHPSPFPLYKSSSRRSTDNRLKQSVHILPMGTQDAASDGQRYVLVQINDMTQSVNRERLLKAQATALHGMARMDALTGIGNRRHFDETLALVAKLGINSTPTLVLPDGQILPGYKKADDLLKILGTRTAQKQGVR